MQVDQNDDADRRGSQRSDPGDSNATSQPLAGRRLTDKLRGLAEWRINSSSIKFPEDGPQFRGGFAAVSRAFLVPASASKSSADESAQTGGENESDDGTPRRKVIAVKKLKIENGKDKERVLALALREAEFLTELSHENVIKLEGFVEDLAEDRVWLVFPWAAHGNLKDFVASVDWEVPERISLIDDIARGVEYLHNQNPPIYHGDLKSANVLVNLNCRAVITDFGSARRLMKKDPPEQTEKVKKGVQPVLLLETEFCEATNTVTLKGNQFTLRWAAPELLMEDEPGMEPGLWSDIWALGWIFYEPMVIPDPQRASNTSGFQARSPELLIKLGSMHLNQDDYTIASKYYTEALGICTRTADHAGTCNALWGLAETHRLQAEYSEAVPLYSEIVQICTDTGDRERRVDALWGLAEVHKLQDEYSEAVPLYSEAVQICTEIGDRERSASALLGLAHVHRLQNEYSKAVSLYSEAIQICTDVGDRHGRADGLRGLAEVHRYQKQYFQAIQLLSESLQIRIDTGDRYGRVLTLKSLANIHREQNQYEDAICLYEQMAAILEEIGNTRDAAEVLKEVAKVRQQLEPAKAE